MTTYAVNIRSAYTCEAGRHVQQWEIAWREAEETGRMGTDSHVRAIRVTSAKLARMLRLRDLHRRALCGKK